MDEPHRRRLDRPVHPPPVHGRADRSEDRFLMSEIERHEYDVVVIGAGGAGLRAAIEAHTLGAKTAIVCKSLLGKAHTVMAEGGIAAALGNVWPEDSWKVHFRDTMRGGKLLNNWRMAQLHAQEAPDRVLELEDWGALFDRTKAGLIDMEMTQFHPTAMVWPLSVRGILVTEGVRGDGGTLKNSKGDRFMFKYIPEFFRADTADTEREADAWYEDKKNNRRTPDLLPRDEVARAINTEVKAGRGTEHGGVFLDIASRRPADYIRRRLPSMYHQFKELADVDITKEAMEVGPTLHYIMGGIRVDADTAAATVPGLYAAGEVAAGMHGANRLGGNSLSDLLVFGKRAGQAAAEYSKRTAAPRAYEGQQSAFAQRFAAPFERGGDENPYAIHAELQDTMQDLVGIIRRRDELEEALARLERLRASEARNDDRDRRARGPYEGLARRRLRRRVRGVCRAVGPRDGRARRRASDSGDACA